MEEAMACIAAEIDRFYADSLPEIIGTRADDVIEAGRILGLLWATNVFPAMELGWDHYPDHLGHPGFEGGCFRCHGAPLATDSGDAIRRDCDLCHQVLAMDAPADQLRLETR